MTLPPSYGPDGKPNQWVYIGQSKKELAKSAALSWLFCAAWFTFFASLFGLALC